MLTFLPQEIGRALLALGFAGWILSLSDTAPASASEKVLHVFQGGSDGALPDGGLVADKEGNLFGTTSNGGAGCTPDDCGTVFMLAPDHTESVLYAFKGGVDGAGPDGSLLADKSGALYGVTGGGGGNCGCGTVFELASDGTETVLYAFQGGSDGWYPAGALTADAHGNLYGATLLGGNYNGANCSEYGCGTVFELKPNGTKTTLYAFQGGGDGQGPNGSFVRDASGNLYGTTIAGGVCNGNASGCGTVFEIAPDGTETVVYPFQGDSDGETPYGGLIADEAGNFYGTTFLGGDTGACTDGCGTVFKVNPSGVESVLYAFRFGADGGGLRPD
jgi:uncharacterized repeat protein (TIGR03803 family)